MKGKRTCPNPDCDRYSEPTGLIGGCDCGTALVSYRSLDEQVSDALWEMGAPTMKALVGPVRFAEMDRARARLIRGDGDER